MPSEFVWGRCARYIRPVRLFRLMLPIAGMIVMMVAEGNQTLLYVSYTLLGAWALWLAAAFVVERRGLRESDER